MKKTIPLLAAIAAFASLPASAEESAAPRLTSGLLAKQGGKLVFTPCRDRGNGPLEDATPGGSLTAALNGIGLDGGRQLYVELFGKAEGQGFKASGLNFARPEGRCQPTAAKAESWMAAGDGWGLITEGGKVLVKLPGKVDVAVPTGQFKTEAALTSYEGGQGANRLALRFERAACQQHTKEDGEVLLGWTATVTVNGETLKGCAWQR